MGRIRRNARLTVTERAVFGAIFATCAGVLVWLAMLLGSTFDDAAAERDRDMIIKGGHLSWQAADACGRGQEWCEIVLPEVNRKAKRYGVRVEEDGSISPR